MSKTVLVGACVTLIPTFSGLPSASLGKALLLAVESASRVICCNRTLFNSAAWVPGKFWMSSENNDFSRRFNFTVSRIRHAETKVGGMKNVTTAAAMAPNAKVTAGIHRGFRRAVERVEAPRLGAGSCIGFLGCRLRG